MTGRDVVVVYTAPNLLVAEMIKDFLQAEGIWAALRSRGLSPFIGVDQVEVLVPPEKEEEARLVVAAYLEGGREDTPDA